MIFSDGHLLRLCLASRPVKIHDFCKRTLAPPAKMIFAAAISMFADVINTCLQKCYRRTKKKSHHPYPPPPSPLRPRHRRPSARTGRERERKGRGAAPPPPPKEGSRRCLHDDKENDHEQHEQGAPSPHHHRIPPVCRSRIHYSRTSLLPDPTTPAIELCTTATERHGCSLPHHRR